MAKTCYIYCRVSTDEQAKEGYSVENQKRACSEYAKSNGFDIKAIFADEGESARTTNRPEFQKMMIALKERPVDALISYKIDRISRNVSDFANLRKELKKYGN